MRMAALYQYRGLIERVLEELLIGLDQQALWHVAVGIGQHAVSRDDGESFDAGRAGHVTRGGGRYGDCSGSKLGAKQPPFQGRLDMAQSLYPLEYSDSNVQSCDHSIGRSGEPHPAGGRGQPAAAEPESAGGGRGDIAAADANLGPAS